MEIAQHKHFFISYSSMDQQWAQWIAWQLESANYTTILQAWDFRAGNNLILAVDTALRQAERILALLSPDYLASSFSSIEWANAILRDPRGEDGLLVPVLIRHCPIEGLLSQLIPIDLTNQDEQTARTILLDKVQRSRRKPASAPNYPDIPTLARKQPSFPNSTQEHSPILNNLDNAKTRNRNPAEELSKKELSTMDDQYANPPIGIITALPKEYAAMKVLIEDSREEMVDGERYTRGRIPLFDRGWQNIILALLAGMGNNLAATRVTALLKSFPSVKEIIMVGIAGGVPTPENPNEDVRLGDVVVSNAYGAIQFDSIKKTTENIIYRPYPRAPSARLLKAAQYLEAEQLAGNSPWLPFIPYVMETLKIQRPVREKDKLAITQTSTSSLQDSDEPRIFLAPIGSSNTLLKDPIQRDELRDRFGIKAIEMEAAGVADATWSADAGYLIVRGISDYCDVNKNDIWQNYAASVAAAYVRALLASIPQEHSTSSPQDLTTPSDIVAQYTHHQKTHACTIDFTLSQKHTLEYQLEWHGFKGDRFTLTLDKHRIIDTRRQFLGIPHLQKSFEVENIRGSFSYINQRNPSNPVNRFKVSITLGKTILFEKEDGWNS